MSTPQAYTYGSGNTTERGAKENFKLSDQDAMFSVRQCVSFINDRELDSENFDIVTLEVVKNNNIVKKNKN